MKKFLAIIMAICLMVSVLVACDKQNTPDETSKPDPTSKPTAAPTDAPTDAPVDADEAKYLEAFDMLEQKNYEGAYALFTELGDYKDAAKEAAKFRYVLASYKDTYTAEEGTETCTGVHSFNEDNLIMQCVYTYADGGTHTCDCSYNDNGELAKIVCTDEDGTRTHYECLFNDDGTVAKVTYCYSDGEYYSFENVYDENGKRIKINYETETEKIVYDVIYNDKDEIVRYSVKDENGTEIEAEEHVYDENGKLKGFVEMQRANEEHAKNVMEVLDKCKKQMDDLYGIVSREKEMDHEVAMKQAEAAVASASEEGGGNGNINVILAEGAGDLSK